MQNFLIKKPLRIDIVACMSPCPSAPLSRVSLYLLILDVIHTRDSSVSFNAKTSLIPSSVCTASGQPLMFPHVSTSLDMAFCTQTAFQHPVSIRSSRSGVLLDGTSAFPPRSGVSLPLSPLVDERQRGSRLDQKGQSVHAAL